MRRDGIMREVNLPVRQMLKHKGFYNIICSMLASTATTVVFLPQRPLKPGYEKFGFSINWNSGAMITLFVHLSAEVMYQLCKEEATTV